LDCSALSKTVIAGLDPAIQLTSETAAFIRLPWIARSIPAMTVRGGGGERDHGGRDSDFTGQTPPP